MERHVLKGNLLVKELERKEESVNGIILPSKDVNIKGEVIVGGTEVEVGDVITYQKESPRPPALLKIDGEDYWLLKESNVLYID